MISVPCIVMCNYKVHHPHCVPKLTILERMYLSNTTLFDGRCMYRIYYIKYTYMYCTLYIYIYIYQLSIYVHIISTHIIGTIDITT